MVWGDFRGKKYPCLSWRLRCEVASEQCEEAGEWGRNAFANERFYFPNAFTALGILGQYALLTALMPLHLDFWKTGM